MASAGYEEGHGHEEGQVKYSERDFFDFIVTVLSFVVLLSPAS
jgi:hypothetical protein